MDLEYNGGMFKNSEITRFHSPLQWKKRLVQQFFHRKFLLGVAFILALSFFLHYREVRIPYLELGEKAKKYVLAQVAFEFPDKAATSFLRQEAMRDIGLIYRLDEEQIMLLDRDIDEYLCSDSSWREELPDAPFDTLYSAKTALRESLLKFCFVDARTMQKIQDTQFSPSQFIFFPVKNSFSAQKMPLEVYQEIQKRIFPHEELTSSLQRYISRFLEGYEWHFRKDLSVQNALRQLVKSSVPVKYTKIEAGARVINAGDIVTTRHIDMMQAMKQKLTAQQNLITPLTVLGSISLASLLSAIALFYIRYQQPDILRSFRKLSLLATVIIFSLFMAKVAEYLFVNKGGELVYFFSNPIVVLLGTLLSALLLGNQISLLVAGFLGLVLGITLAIEFDLFLVINLSVSLVAITLARKIRRRKEIFEVCFKAWLVAVPMLAAFNFMEDNFWSMQLLGHWIATFLFVMGTSVIVVALLPAFEWAFDVMTNMTLMEYNDPNHPLLRRLSAEAPGTYQHSHVLGAIAEAAAQTIGANGLLCRVAALYHDIGKLSNPLYFTENQMGEFNVHHLLTPTESAQVILSHVTEGVLLAQQYSLPRSFVDIIREHHGTSAVYCFYRAQVELLGDSALVDVGSFRYAGPKPRSKESGIIMLADTVEAAFRSLDEVSEPNVAILVDSIVAEKIQGGQLDECRLTFEELGLIKKAIVRTLLVTRHSRIKYPGKEFTLPKQVGAYQSSISV